MFNSKQVKLDAAPSKCMPPPLRHSHICTQITLTFDLWPSKLLTVPTHMMNISQISSKFLHWVHRYCITRNVNGQGTDGQRTDGRASEKHDAFATYRLRRRHKM